MLARGGLAPRLLAPELLMQLRLQTHRQLVAQYPVGEPAGFEFAVRRRKQYRTNRSKIPFVEQQFRPRVVSFVEQHELDFVALVQVPEIAPRVLRRLARARRLDIEYARDAGIHRRDVDRAARFEGHRIAAFAQRRQERVTVLLRERLAAGDRDKTCAIVRRRIEHRCYRHRVAAVKGVRGIAVAAAQRAARKAYEHRRQAGAAGFALQGKKYFRDSKRGGEIRGVAPQAVRGRGVSGFAPHCSPLTPHRPTACRRAPRPRRIPPRPTPRSAPFPFSPPRPPGDLRRDPPEGFCPPPNLPPLFSRSRDLALHT